MDINDKNSFDSFARKYGFNSLPEKICLPQIDPLVGPIDNGFVIDHIAPENTDKLVQALNIEELDCPIAVIYNASSRRMGRKGIIKARKKADGNLLSMLNSVSKEATLDIILDNRLVGKYRAADYATGFPNPRKDSAEEFTKGIEKLLSNGNNFIHLEPVRIDDKHNHPWIRHIENGFVLDHLNPGAAQKIASLISSYKKNHTFVTASRLSSKSRGIKDLIKVLDAPLDITTVKTAALISYDLTFNIVQNGYVIAKMKSLICSNPNCRSLILPEAPLEFYADDSGTIKCSSCNHPYEKNIHGKDKYASELRMESVLKQKTEDLRIKITEMRTSENFKPLREIGNSYSFLSEEQYQKLEKEHPGLVSQVKELAGEISKYLAMHENIKRVYSEWDLIRLRKKRIKTLDLDAYAGERFARKAEETNYDLSLLGKDMLLTSNTFKAIFKE